MSSTSTSSRTSPRPDSPRIAGPMSGAGDPSTLRHRDEHTVAFQRDGPAIIGIAASAVDEQGLACRLAHDSLVLRTVEVEVEPSIHRPHLSSRESPIRKRRTIWHDNVDISLSCRQMAPFGDLWVIRRTRHRKACTTPGLFASFRPSVVHAPDTGLESNPVFLDISRKTNDIMYHTRSCKRLHELVWPSAWPHHGQIGQNHAGVAQLRNEGTRRPAVSAKIRDAELRMIPRKCSATPVTFCEQPSTLQLRTCHA